MLQININEIGGCLMCLFEHKGVRYQAVQDWVGTSIAESHNPFHPVYMDRRESRERSREDMVKSISNFTGTDVSEVK